MKFEIKKHKNGYLIKAEDEEEGVVYEENEADEFTAFANFLRTLTDFYGPQEDGRYSEKRIYVRIEPGDKWDAPEGKENEYFCEKCGKYIKE